MKKHVRIIVALGALLFLLASCVPGDGRNTAEDPANLLWGIWHGWIAPVSLVLSLFKDRNIYEAFNTGFWYDLGYYAGILGGFGSLSLSRKKKKHPEAD